MLTNRYPHGVKFHFVKDKDGDTVINPPQDDITCNTADENVERTNTPLQSSQHHGDKKSNYNGQWTEEDMECAMKDVEDNSYSIRAVGKKWGIPTSTLIFWLSGLTTTKRRGPPMILSLEEELEIVDWCKDMVQLGHGLEIIQLKSHVAHICETRPNPFKNGFPGRSWWIGFCKRHPDLTIRTAEGVQAGRNYGMQVIAKLGSRSVPQILSKSREWITILCCVNAVGHSIPGFYLFKAKRQLKNYIANYEPGACMAAQPHAWMTKEFFLNWLYHFARSISGGVSPTNRHLLIFDSHRSHVALTTIHEARSLGIDLLTLPAHTSHKLQPLDVSVFSPFKAHFKSERSKWMAKHPHIEIRRIELAELASKAFKHALTSENITASF
ncbi:MFS-type transporter clz9-like [Cryptomeria japonica]|uniref:MFS-type transporter clz9-like n=1 Tax=Cryptomeria japonica TaxID=3369 RepID=UPI0027DA74C2|nr:MFS-type transporter clz9-like [Cryptomeria japonica]